MTNDAPDAARILYADLMEEAKGRFDVLRVALEGRFVMHHAFLEEFCYLQLRLLCEIIALGCVVAHGSMGPLELNQFAKTYDADTIVKKMEELHPDFFPRAVTLNVKKPSATEPMGSVHLEYKGSGFLTKPELLKLYGRTGNYLHRGRPKSLKPVSQRGGFDRAAIASATNKMITLLSTHRISAADNQRHWLVILSNADDEGRVQVALAESPMAREQSARRTKPKGRK